MTAPTLASLRPGDVGLCRAVREPVYFELMDTARRELLERALGISSRSTVLVRSECTHVAPWPLDEDVWIESHVENLEADSLTLGYTFTSRQGPVSTGRSVERAVDDLGQSRRFAPAERDALLALRRL